MIRLDAPTYDLDALPEHSCGECFDHGCNGCEPGRFCVDCHADFAAGDYCEHGAASDLANLAWERAS